jgi:hypothetical protein
MEQGNNYSISGYYFEEGCAVLYTHTHHDPPNQGRKAGILRKALALFFFSALSFLEKK